MKTARGKGKSKSKSKRQKIKDKDKDKDKTVMQKDKYFWLGLGGIALMTLVHLAALTNGDINLFFDEAQYWDWSRHLDFGYYSKPPMLAWGIFATTFLCGSGEFCVRLGAPIMHMLTALILMALGTRMFKNSKMGMWTGLLYITLPAVSFSSTIISTDVFLLFFWAAGLWFLYGAQKENRLCQWLGTGVCIGLGMLSKYVMVFFPLSLVIFALWNKSFLKLVKNGKAWLAAVIALALYFPNFYWNYAHSFASYAHTKDNASLDGDLFHPLKCLEFLGSQFGVIGPLLFAVLLIMIFKIRKFKDFNQRFLLSFTLPLLAVITAEALVSRANANWAAAAYPAALVAITAFCWQRGGVYKKLVYLSFALHLTLAGVLYTEALTLSGDSRLDLYRRAKGWDKAGEALSLVQKSDPDTLLLLADERKVLTPFLYYARPQPDKIYKWNRAHALTDHYDLTTDMNEAKGKDFLLITRRADPSEFAPYFAKVESKGKILVPLYKDYKIELNLFKLHDFKGY